jgi:hypothetical protein
MPLFNRTENLLKVVRQKDFALGKELQTLVENNLEEIFSCRFVASEFSTGVVHSGRIDTIALSEDNNPVIIEYKIVESSQLLNQSLFYLHWLKDHKGDFQIAVHKALGSDKELKTNILVPAHKFQMYILEEQIEEMIDYLKARSSLKYLKVKISKSKGGSFGIDTIIEGLNLKGKVEAKKMSDFEFEITCNNKTEKTSQEIKTCWINEMKIFKSIVDNHSDTTFSIKQKIDNSFGMSVDIEKFLGLSGNVFDIYTYEMECTLY